MTSPWLRIPIDAYEGHMALPAIAQSTAIASQFARLLQHYRPESVALLGCAGGNGLNCIDSSATKRVVAVDINPEYIATTRQRYAHQLPGLEVVLCDIEHDRVSFEPVDLVFAALLLEYVNLEQGLRFIRKALRPGGTVEIIIQLPSQTVPAVTPSPYSGAFVELGAHMMLVDPEALSRCATSLGFLRDGAETMTMPNGKMLQAWRFKLRAQR
jgi:SAM-dependent methyltransferase